MYSRADTNLCGCGAAVTKFPPIAKSVVVAVTRKLGETLFQVAFHFLPFYRSFKVSVNARMKPSKNITIYHKSVSYTRNSNKIEIHIELNSIAHSGTALKPNKTENVSPAFIKFCLPFGKVHCS